MSRPTVRCLAATLVLAVAFASIPAFALGPAPPGAQAPYTWEARWLLELAWNWVAGLAAICAPAEGDGQGSQPSDSPSGDPPTDGSPASSQEDGDVGASTDPNG